jgi:hypothetical protein
MYQRRGLVVIVQRTDGDSPGSNPLWALRVGPACSCPLYIGGVTTCGASRGDPLLSPKMFCNVFQLFLARVKQLLILLSPPDNIYNFNTMCCHPFDTDCNTCIQL